MDTFSALNMLVRSAEERNFSVVARQLGVTPAAVSKQVAKLEQELGVQLVVRTTRSLSLTEAGARLVAEAMPGLQQVQAALASTNPHDKAISGTLKVSLATGFGRDYILPIMLPLLTAHPNLRFDWHFENRQIDLVAEGFDAAIGGGFDISGGLVARPLTPLHLVLVAAPEYLKNCGKPVPKTPRDLMQHAALVLRAPSTGRARNWDLQTRHEHTVIEPNVRIWLSAPEALADAAVAGYGIALAGMAHVRRHLDNGDLVRLLPQWWSDVGNISLYFPSSRRIPPKTRVFVDYVITTLQSNGLAKILSATK